MKTQNNNNRKSFFTALAVIGLMTITSLSASAEPEKELNKSVDSVTISEILVELEDVDLSMADIETMASSQSIEIYNAQDQLVFSGTSQEYENMKNPADILLKRKADFLFESGNTKVYKIF